MHAPDWSSVVLRFLAMFLVVLAGWRARRAGWFNGSATAALGRLTVEIAFPCLTFTQMLRTVDAAALSASWAELVVGAMVILAAGLVAALAARVFAPAGARTTATFLAGMPNWIFLPLPIAAAMYGDSGVKTVLLINVPAQVLLWTAGVAILRGGLRGVHSLREMATNPGLLATAAGVLLALLVPESRGWEQQGGLAGALVQTMIMVGAVTIPLSLVVTGAQLGDLESAPASERLLPLVLAVRLVAAPLLTLPLLWCAARVLPLRPEALVVAAVIASMPVAVSCGMFVERFGGDRHLASRAILFSTLASLATVPAFLYLAQRWLG